MTDAELQELKRLLVVEDCSPLARRLIESLIDDVERIGFIIDSIDKDSLN